MKMHVGEKSGFPNTFCRTLPMNPIHQWRRLSVTISKHPPPCNRNIHTVQPLSLIHSHAHNALGGKFGFSNMLCVIALLQGG